MLLYLDGVLPELFGTIFDTFFFFLHADESVGQPAFPSVSVAHPYFVLQVNVLFPHRPGVENIWPSGRLRATRRFANINDQSIQKRE